MNIKILNVVVVFFLFSVVGFSGDKASGCTRKIKISGYQGTKITLQVPRNIAIRENELERTNPYTVPCGSVPLTTLSCGEWNVIFTSIEVDDGVLITVEITNDSLAEEEAGKKRGLLEKITVDQLDNYQLYQVILPSELFE